MCYVSQAHTHTNAQRQRQDIGTPTHLLRLLSRAPLHFAPIQFSSLHLSRSGELACGITRIHKRRQAVDAARSAWPLSPPPPGQKTLSKAPCLLDRLSLRTSCCQFVCQITNAPQSQTKIWTGPCRSCHQPATPPFRFGEIHAPAHAHLGIAMADIW